LKEKRCPTADACKRKIDAWLISLIPAPVSDCVARIAGAFHAFFVGAENIASGEDPDPPS
jgi:hypothetical protein